jgi:hypothetical protein
MSNEPPIFPLNAVDSNGRTLLVGDVVVIQSVRSCVTELPNEDKARLSALVGQRRSIIQIDRSGFVWLSFSSEATSDFCLFPSEVCRA